MEVRVSYPFGENIHRVSSGHHGYPVLCPVPDVGSDCTFGQTMS